MLRDMDAEPEHKRLMLEAIAREGDGHRALLDGDGEAAAGAYGEAAALYRRSWEHAPPGAYGRLVGMIKATILSGADAGEAATYVTGQITDEEATTSAPAAYARATAALIENDDEAAATFAGQMRTGGDAFDRAGSGLLALARRDPAAYAEAIGAIVADFAARQDHLTGVRIADTAAMLERLAERRGLAAHPATPLL